MVRVLDLTEKAEGKSVWVFGDIHGEFDLFCALLDKIGFQKETHLIVSVGDLVDRGPNSPAVVDWFSKNGYAVRGNHEEMWLETTAVSLPYTNNELQEVWTRRHHGAWLVANGMTSTLAQFMDQRVPAEQWLSYLATMPYTIVIGDWLIVHAGVHPARAFEEQSAQDLTWIKYDGPIPPAARMGKRLVRGHIETFHLGALGEAVTRDHSVWIDIGTANQIALAAFCLNTEEVVMVDHPNRAVAEPRIRNFLNHTERNGSPERTD